MSGGVFTRMECIRRDHFVTRFLFLFVINEYSWFTPKIASILVFVGESSPCYSKNATKFSSDQV
jgi:hypothetical protein